MIRSDFNRAIMIDFQGATISSDTGFILLREVDERFASSAHGRLPGMVCSLVCSPKTGPFKMVQIGGHLQIHLSNLTCGSVFGGQVIPSRIVEFLEAVKAIPGITYYLARLSKKV